MRFKNIFTLIGSILAALAAPASLPVSPAAAQQADAAGIVIPNFRDPQRRLEAPDLSGLTFIRFLTTSDFPPFNYVTPDEKIAGFNIDLARALCEELKLTCVVQVRPWNTLEKTVAEARENAVIAAVSITAETRKTYDFTNRYLTTPARFAARSDEPAVGLTPNGLAEKSIGVVEGSAHEAFIATYFPNVHRLAYSSAKAAFDAMKDKFVDMVFADGVALAFWLNGAESKDCCAFVGGPYEESAFFGEGLAIGIAPGNDTLRQALNFALDRIQSDGRFQEIYLRNFPLSIY